MIALISSFQQGIIRWYSDDFSESLFFCRHHRRNIFCLKIVPTLIYKFSQKNRAKKPLSSSPLFARFNTPGLNHIPHTPQAKRVKLNPIPGGDGDNFATPLPSLAVFANSMFFFAIFLNSTGHFEIKLGTGDPGVKGYHRLLRPTLKGQFGLLPFTFKEKNYLKSYLNVG